MSKTKEQRREDLVVTLTRVRSERPSEYLTRIVQYENMRGGGDGGPWREGADTPLRELHYKGWYDEDFQIVLEKLGESPVLTEEERAERFSYEKKSFWGKLKSSFGG